MVFDAAEALRVIITQEAANDVRQRRTVRNALRLALQIAMIQTVCTFREQNTIRMISARLATAAEKERYENGEDYYA